MADHVCGIIWHRKDHAANDAAVVYDGPTLMASYLKQQDSGPDSLICNQGWDNLEWHALASGATSEDDTFLLTIVGIPKGLVVGASAAPRAHLIIEAVVTIGTAGASLLTNHPITGAASTTLFQHADAFSVSRSGVAYTTYDAGGANTQGRLVHACSGYAHFFAFITSRTADLGNVQLVARPVSRFA